MPPARAWARSLRGVRRLRRASLARAYDDAKPALMLTATAAPHGKTVLYKSLVDESLKLASTRRARCSSSRRGLTRRCGAHAPRC